MNFSIIVAVDAENGIAKDGKIPWKCHTDMKYFKDLTIKTLDKDKKNAVIMGRKTQETIPGNILKNRFNIVLTNNDHLLHYSKFIPFLRYKSISKGEDLPWMIYRTIFDGDKIENIFIIGGEQIYELALKSSQCEYIYLTKIYRNYECDKFFTVPNNYRLIKYELKNLDVLSDIITINGLRNIIYEYADIKHTKLAFCVYERSEIKRVEINRNEIREVGLGNKPNEEENQYLNILSKIIKNGYITSDRTGVGTLKINGGMMRFSLKNNKIPLLTTKRVFWKGVVKELLWFISGSTDSKILEKDGIDIWKGNTSREFLDGRGLNYEVGDIGAGYGFQFRHYGEKYEGISLRYKGFDQLQFCIDEIKHNPSSRRIMINLYNVSDLNKMALPPCHFNYQFLVDDNKYLSCVMNMRSNDIMLGAPFNIASGSLLTHMIANICGLRAKELIYVIADTHIYLNHIDGVIEQLKREPYEFPTIEFKRKFDNIDDIKYEDIVLKDYKSHSGIKMKMAI
jgi:dihydrofolate reductase / thymidylate synthase